MKKYYEHYFSNYKCDVEICKRKYINFLLLNFYLKANSLKTSLKKTPEIIIIWKKSIHHILAFKIMQITYLKSNANYIFKSTKVIQAFYILYI